MEAKAASFDERAVTPESARRILGKDGENYSDEEMADIVERLYLIAEFGLSAESGLHSTNSNQK